MKLVYTHENTAIVQNARNLLDNHDIKSILKNEFASGGAGDLVPGETWPELWVLDDEDFSSAIEFLTVLSDKTNEPDWQCQRCNEQNGAMFESCWSCQAIPNL